MAETPVLKIENAQIIFRNLAGRKTMYNAEGNRNFCLLLDEEVAHQMERDGWNIKHLRPREEGDTPKPYLPVAVSYKNRPPRVLLLTSKGRTLLTEDVVEFVDLVDIDFVDVTVRPYNWDVSGRQGVKAYVQTMYVKVREDPLDLKYADVEEITMDGRSLEAGPQTPELEAGEPHEIIEGDWR
jgi:hypothetical protein